MRTNRYQINQRYQFIIIFLHFYNNFPFSISHFSFLSFSFFHFHPLFSVHLHHTGLQSSIVESLIMHHKYFFPEGKCLNNILIESSSKDVTKCKIQTCPQIFILILNGHHSISCFLIFQMPDLQTMPSAPDINTIISQ